MDPNPKTNLLRVIHHDRPAWVPNGLESSVMLRPPVVERSAAPGLDAFGVRWSYEAGAKEGTFPAPDGSIAASGHGVPYAPALIAVMNDQIVRHGRRVYAAAEA